MKNSILCLLGFAGTGKLTIAQQIAHPRPFTLNGNHALHNAARGCGRATQPVRPRRLHIAIAQQRPVQVKENTAYFRHQLPPLLFPAIFIAPSKGA